MNDETLYLNKHISDDHKIRIIYNQPSACPLCHSTFSTLPKSSMLISNSNKDLNLYCFYICLNCYRGFVAEYTNPKRDGENSYAFIRHPKLSPCNVLKKDFDSEIKELSSDFVETYNEAYAAEQHGLTKICGMGYRRALEYIIKDYLIHKFPNKSDNIKADSLSACIKNKDYNVCDNIKITANTCAWLGNDHSHYIIKHTDKDLSDLKELLNITVYWILMELKTENAMKIEPK